MTDFELAFPLDEFELERYFAHCFKGFFSTIHDDEYYYGDFTFEAFEHQVSESQYQESQYQESQETNVCPF